MVHYSSHVLNSELIVRYSNGKKFVNRMAFGYQNFYNGCQSNGLDHSFSYCLNTEQVKVRYLDKFTIQIFVIQIPTGYQLVVMNACDGRF